MGFYGNIINPPSQTQMYFDKTYSNLAELRANEKVDGVYSGRYVLVEYSNPVSLQGTLKEQNGGYYTIYSNHIDEKTKDKIIYNNSNESLGYISLNDIVQVNNNIIYKCEKFSADGLALFTKLYTPSKTGDNYFINFNIDEQVFGTIGRGYDSTVWQKVFLDDDNSQKYVMIAELNSVTPTFDIYTIPPTDEPQRIEWDSNSTSLTYIMNIPTQWGFQLKDQPTYNKEGFNPQKTTKTGGTDTFSITSVSSKTKYPIGSEGVTNEAEDTKQLTVNLPSIGNIMSDVWDNVYGKSEGDDPRPLYPIKDEGLSSHNENRIYKKSDGLYRYINEKAIELPLDDETGSLKALQLQMHKYLATGEESPNENTIPGAIKKVNDTNDNINAEWTTLKGLKGKNEGFKTIHGAIDELENTNTNINNEWVSLRGEKPDQWENVSEKTVYDAIKAANDAKKVAEQATADAKEANKTAKEANDIAKEANDIAQNTNNTAIAATNLAGTLIGTKPTDWDGQAITTLYDAIERGDELIGKLTPAEDRIAQLEKINNIEGIIYASKSGDTTNFSGIGVQSLDRNGSGIKTSVNNKNITIQHASVSPKNGMTTEELNIGDSFNIREMTADEYGHITLGNTTKFSIDFKGTEYFYIDIDKTLYKEYIVKLSSGLNNKYEIELFNTANTGGEGWYFIAAAATFDKDAAGERSFELMDQPGGDMIRACSGTTTNMYTSLIKYFSDSNYPVKAMVRQTSGSDLNVSVKFYCVKLPGTHEIASLN